MSEAFTAVAEQLEALPLDARVMALSAAKGVIDACGSIVYDDPEPLARASLAIDRYIDFLRTDSAPR